MDRNCFEEARMMMEIQELSFICADLNLFLDTHADNEHAAMDYSCYSQQLNALKQEYEENFGPLNNFGEGFHSTEFRWTESPWPWEYQGR